MKVFAQMSNQEQGMHFVLPEIDLSPLKDQFEYLQNGRTEFIDQFIRILAPRRQFDKIDLRSHNDLLGRLSQDYTQTSLHSREGQRIVYLNNE